jgi:hypothetical protein
VPRLLSSGVLLAGGNWASASSAPIEALPAADSSRCASPRTSNRAALAIVPCRSGTPSSSSSFKHHCVLKQSLSCASTRFRRVSVGGGERLHRIPRWQPSFDLGPSRESESVDSQLKSLRNIPSQGPAVSARARLLALMQHAPVQPTQGRQSSTQNFDHLLLLHSNADLITRIRHLLEVVQQLALPFPCPAIVLRVMIS